VALVDVVLRLRATVEVEDVAAFKQRLQASLDAVVDGLREDAVFDADQEWIAQVREEGSSNEG